LINVSYVKPFKRQ